MICSEGLSCSGGLQVKQRGWASVTASILKPHLISKPKLSHNPHNAFNQCFETSRFLCKRTLQEVQDADKLAKSLL